MWRTLFISVILLSHLHCCQSQRRIVYGKPVASEKGFVVYLVRSELSNKQHKGWLCGGAIVSPSHILTAAACLEDISNLYAIAGTRKYVPTELLEEDECTKNRKQRIVKTCTPASYRFDYVALQSWMAFNIGVAIVEKPYSFTDKSFLLHCDYLPRAARVNYYKDPEQPPTSAVTFGWGHQAGLRLPGDDGDYNSEYMYEASTVIKPKPFCISYFKIPRIEDIVMKSMICCDNIGMFDGDGEEAGYHAASRSVSCPNKFRRDLPDNPEDCDIVYLTRRNNNSTSNDTSTIKPFKRVRNIIRKRQNIKKNNKNHKRRFKNLTRTGNIDGRRANGPGICQNDHGSPLVTWLGSEVVVIGVAISSRINSKFNCIPPYLYASTFCVSRFLRCVLTGARSSRRFCDEMEKKDGYTLRETVIPWNKSNSELPDRFVNMSQSEVGYSLLIDLFRNHTEINSSSEEITSKHNASLTTVLPKDRVRNVSEPLSSLLLRAAKGDSFSISPMGVSSSNAPEKIIANDNITAKTAVAKVKKTFEPLSSLLLRAAKGDSFSILPMGVSSSNAPKKISANDNITAKTVVAKVNKTFEPLSSLLLRAAKGESFLLTLTGVSSSNASEKITANDNITAETAVAKVNKTFEPLSSLLLGAEKEEPFSTSPPGECSPNSPEEMTSKYNASFSTVSTKD